MNIEFSFTRPVRPEDLQRLLAQTHWAGSRGVADLKRMLEHSSLCLGAWQDERLVAFARVITDDMYRAVIDDVVVDQPSRGQGLGARILALLVERLRHVEQVRLLCDDAVVEYYLQRGFQRAGCNLLELNKTAEAE